MYTTKQGSTEEHSINMLTFFSFCKNYIFHIHVRTYYTAVKPALKGHIVDKEKVVF
jgi:hypothetical protein